MKKNNARKFLWRANVPSIGSLPAGDAPSYECFQTAQESVHRMLLTRQTGKLLEEVKQAIDRKLLRFQAELDQ